MPLQSIHHPGDTSRPVLALQAQARPVAIALIAVMTVGLAAALEGAPILWPFLWAVGMAYTGGVVVAQWRLHETPAEIEWRGPFVVVRSIWEAAPGPRRDALEPVYEARLANGELTVSVGDSVRTFRPADWPAFDELVAGFRGAAGEAALLGTGPLPT